MKKYNIIETLRLFVMKAQTHKAIDELYQFCNQNNISEYIDQIVLLSSNLTEIKNSEVLGLGRYIEEKNRINLALLDIIKKLEEQITNQEQILTGTAENTERLDLIESKIDFLLRHIEKNDDLAYYGFSNSKLWDSLEPSSKENLINANIIEKNGVQDDYADAILLYLNAVATELEIKFLQKFKEEIRKEKIDRAKVVSDMKGNNKGVFFDYLVREGKLSLNQISEIMLQNIFLIEKTNLIGIGTIFFKIFHSVFKVKNKKKITNFFEKYSYFKEGKRVRGFSQTLIDVVNTKDNVVSLFLNLQPVSRNKE